MVIVCRQCGQGAEAGVEFCPSCGAFLEWEGDPVPASGDPPVDPSARAATPQTGDRVPDPGPPPAGPGAPPSGAGPSAPGAPPPGADPSTSGAAPAGPARSRPGPAGPGAAGPGPRLPRSGPGGGAQPSSPPRPGETFHRPAPMAGGAAPGAHDVPPAPGPAGGGPVPASVGTGRVPAGGSVVCLECGGRNEPDRRFCRRCGSTLDLVALSGRPPSIDGGEAAPARSDPGAVPSGPAGAAADLAARGGLVARPPSAPAAVPPSHVEARPPAVAGRSPVPAPGQQPAEARPRPGPVRPQRAEVAVAPGGPLCGQCGTANPPGRRFCRHCGAATAPSSEVAPVPAAAPGRPPLWQRLTGRGAERRPGDPAATPTRAARAAYRQSLDVRYRVMRVMGAVAGVGLLAGSLGLAGVNPISGARGLWDRFFPRDELVGQLAAQAVPADGVDPNFAPGAAVDGDPGTAWATTWQREPGAEPLEGCTDDDPTATTAPAGATGTTSAPGDGGTGGGEAALVVTLPDEAEVSKIEVQPGLAAGDPGRAAQWQPTLLELRFDDGSCTTFDLADKAGFQGHRLDRPRSGTVRVTVLDAAPPTDLAASRGLVSIGEIRVFTPK